MKKEEERLEASISSKYNTVNKVLAEFNEKLIRKYKQNLINDNGMLYMMENNHFKAFFIAYSFLIIFLIESEHNVLSI